MLKVACANPDAANQLTGRICIYDHLVNIRKGICIPIRCVKCQEYSHIQDSCIGVEKCSNCTSEFHSSDECDRSPSCVSCGPGGLGIGGCRGCLVLFGVVPVVSSQFPVDSRFHRIVVACIPHNRGFLRDSGTAPHGDESGIRSTSCALAIFRTQILQHHQNPVPRT